MTCDFRGPAHIIIQRFALATLCLALLTGLSQLHAEQPSSLADARNLAETVDRQLEEHWRRAGIVPAATAGDGALFRRVMLDLAGRVPTAHEMDRFQGEPSADRYGTAVQKLLAGPEFAWHFGSTLDEMVQGPFAGNANFVAYLRKSLEKNKPWDQVFREVLLGPWDNDERKGAANFLDRRAKDMDRLTADVTRSFFGVDITCARCHNHPLVRDWKREHYYGMSAFLVRTTGGKGTVSEKPDGEARFTGKGGQETVAKMMFLSGRIVNEAAGPWPKGQKFSRREQLVRVVLEDKQFLSRAFVNRTWEYFFGRGLVEPVDQLHSANPASVPTVLDGLAEDFMRNGYDVRRLVAGIVLTRAYRLDGRWLGGPSPPPAEHFAVARLRPLAPRQLATALLVVLGTGSFEPTPASLQALEKQTAGLIPKLDPRTPDFQSSTGEALFLSNSEAIRKLIAAGGDNLTDRLAKFEGDHALVNSAYAEILGRAPSATESERVAGWMKQSKLARRLATEHVVWSLVTSAEFRFNH